MAVAAQQAAPQTKDDAISGRVITDSGQPLPGVTVSLLTIGSRGAGVTTTDNEGRFKLPGLDGGIYRIVLRAPGYVTQIPDVASPAFRPGDNAELTLIKGGVIAGNIINFAGEPVVNIPVHAYQVRDADGNKVARQFAQTRVTDDRGYYRLYGLSPGTYTVAAGGQGAYPPLVNPYANDAMTYAPASTRDTAAEIVVRSNQEVTADIRYRGEPGHAVSGKVSGSMPPFPFNPGVRLSDVESRFVVTVAVNSPDRTFQFNGVTDGDYEIDAIAGGSSGQQTDLLASAPRRITVKGADVTGLDLTLATTGAIDSRATFETDQKLNCGRRRDTALRETLITLRRGRLEDKTGAAKDKPVAVSDTLFPSASESIPNDKGEVHFRSLPPGNYRFEVRLPAAGWYLKDLTLGRPEPNIARNGISIKQGEKISGVAITIAEGGASLRGRVTAAEGQTLPPNLRLYLAPAEREHSDNPLHFFEAPVTGDGTFAVGNIAPGRYFLVSEAAEPAGPDSFKTTRTDAGWRAKILRDATALNKDITFKPCERTADYEFAYSSTKP